MIGKKGILLNSVLRILLAVVVLIGFVYLGTNLYGAVSNSEMDNAQQVIEQINGKIDALISLDVKESKFSLQSPCEGKSCEWFIQGWSVNDGNRPDRCYTESCICICEGIGADNCQNVQTGFCRSVDRENVKVVQIVSVPKFDSRPGLIGSPITGKEEGEINYISFSDPIIELEMSVSDEAITLKSYNLEEGK